MTITATLIGFAEPAVGLRGYAAIHRENFGVALGGTRLLRYASDDEAITDVLRLARGMGRKSAMADLPLDGGKIVLIADTRSLNGESEQEALTRLKSPAYLRAYGAKLRLLAGRFITGEDVNISMSDADTIAEVANTSYTDGTESITIAGLSTKGGDPSPVTAQGVMGGMRACLGHVYGTTDFTGRSVLIQGVGKVGFALAEMVVQAGGNVILSDVNAEPMKQLRRQYRGAVHILPDPRQDEFAVYATACDIFAPCAKGAVLNDRTIPLLRCKIIAGSANNQLQNDGHGYAINRRGIVYAPDYVINAGGLINVYDELHPSGYDRDRVFQQVDAIEGRIAEIIQASASSGVASNKVANGLATEKIGP